MPSRTFITREDKPLPGFTSSKDKLILLLEANEVGDMKLKPVLISHFPNLRDLKNCTKSSPPVLSNWNNKPWRTAYMDDILLQKKSLLKSDYSLTRHLVTQDLWWKCMKSMLFYLQCNEHELGQTPGDGEGQGGMACKQSMGSQRVRHNWVTEKTAQLSYCSPWVKESFQPSNLTI